MGGGVLHRLGVPDAGGHIGEGGGLLRLLPVGRLREGGVFRRAGHEALPVHLRQPVGPPDAVFARPQHVGVREEVGVELAGGEDFVAEHVDHAVAGAPGFRVHLHHLEIAAALPQGMLDSDAVVGLGPVAVEVVQPRFDLQRRGD